MFVLVFECLTRLSLAQTSQTVDTAQQQQLLRYYQGMYELKADYKLDGKIGRIQEKLNKAYGTNFRVIPGETGRAAMSFGRGIIVLDLSISGAYDEETIAGLLSHEWAHEYLGHIYTFQYGYLETGANPYVRFDAQRKIELEADCVGVKHLIKAGYSPIGFIKLIIEKGDVEAFKHPNLRMYYPPQMRLQAIYECASELDPESRQKIETHLNLPQNQAQKHVPCTHKIPCIHIQSCQHTIPCQHQCQDIYTGKRIPCHLYDTQHQYDTQHEYDTEHEFDLEENTSKFHNNLLRGF
ncbi:MAG: hypothetical protein HYS07_05280 [Chlamydiae bacterium]|nr:hypothetical protein [Chlamydiota bacterium]MBI3277999.1 hypothetical protein [Chlamydiota bacterium]